MTSPLPHPGWYPDPHAPTSQRWWDGERWTEHTQRTHAGATTDDGVPLAGWWQRVGAYLIDAAILAVPLVPLQVWLQLTMQDRLQPVLDRFEQQTSSGQQPDLGAFYSDLFAAVRPTMVWVGLASLLLWIVYEGVLLRRNGQTVGMRVLSIRVRARDGDGPLPWGTIARRVAGQFWVSLCYLLPVGPLLALGAVVGVAYSMLDPLWATWDRRNQTLHDKIAGTVVVRHR